VNHADCNICWSLVAFRTFRNVAVLFFLVTGMVFRATAREPLPDAPTGVPVVFEGRELFKVYSRLGSFLPTERVSIILSRLKQLSDDPTYDPSSLFILESSDRSEIATSKLTLATVTDEDAQAIGKPRSQIAQALFKAVELKHITLSGIDAEIAPPTYRLVRSLIFALAAVAIFPYIPGFHSPAFQGVSVFIGALITLGSTSAISNLVAGIMLVYMRPFKIGDRVKIGETVGDVVDKTDLVTRIRTPKNEDVTTPNSLILGAPVTNYSAMAKTTGLILHTAVTIGYDAPGHRYMNCF
jgi:hypothetical protein